ncbi:glycosyltransferase family 4 protein [uncultured Microbacterium sp.]|uniref:glycosyltransferase family 4 protein n=1 Tax=uncultured Microbacterium sp. TaxID=191216 RepID=UPI0028D3AB4F|nr:glycosyltransferase family 4 protein [uncultured Microbacterium sp.]
MRSDRFAGVERFVQRLAIAQAAAGHSVRVIGGDPARMRRGFTRTGILFHPSQGLASMARSILNLGNHVDVVNAHMTDADVAAVLGVMGLRRRPAVVSTRHFTQRRGSRGPSWLYRAVEARIDAEIAISHAVSGSIGVASTIVHSGVDPVATTDPEARESTVLMAQRLQREKRTDIGLRAFAASGLAGQGWQLNIAGSGPLEEELRALADALGVSDAVRMLGFRDDVPALMTRSGMLLAPCPVEGLGLTVLEAMADGLPVVAASAGGHRELLSGLDARALFAPDDVADAAGKLASLADDPVGRARLGRAQRDRQRQDFSVDAQSDATISVYRTAIALRRGSRASRP